jgi:hypothetical protein
VATKSKDLNTGSTIYYFILSLTVVNLKIKLSISVEEETTLKIMDSIRQGRFRNKSHAFEYSINKMLEAKQ